MTTLAAMRRAGVTIELDGDGLDVTGANEAQLEAIKADKPQILAALRNEALTGVQLYENSALAAGIEAAYRQAADNYEFGCDQPACRALIAILDDVSALPLAQALTLYLARKDEMAALTNRINDSRRLMLEGRHLQIAAEDVFRPGIPNPKREVLNAAIF